MRALPFVCWCGVFCALLAFAPQAKATRHISLPATTWSMLPQAVHGAGTSSTSTAEHTVDAFEHTDLSTIPLSPLLPEQANSAMGALGAAVIGFFFFPVLLVGAGFLIAEAVIMIFDIVALARGLSDARTSLGVTSIVMGSVGVGFSIFLLMISRKVPSVFLIPTLMQFALLGLGVALLMQGPADATQQELRAGRDPLRVGAVPLLGYRTSF